MKVTNPIRTFKKGFIYVIKQKEEEPCYGVDCPEKEGEFDEDELRKKDDDDDVEL